MPPESLAVAPPPDATFRARLRRLPGRSPFLRLSRAEVSARLWVDDGQLVQETVRGYTQEIQRFAFSDLQAVQIRRTARGMVYNIVLGLLLALPLIFLVSALREQGSPFRDHRALAITCGLLALPLLANLVRGATCHTVLLTALGPQRLSSLSRVRQARRAVETIVAHVEPIQGTLRPDEAARMVDQAQTQPRSPGDATPAARPNPPLAG